MTFPSQMSHLLPPLAPVTPAKEPPLVPLHILRTWLSQRAILATAQKGAN